MLCWILSLLTLNLALSQKRHPDCDLWAYRDHQCTANPGFMWSTCLSSCLEIVELGVYNTGAHENAQSTHDGAQCRRWADEGECMNNPRYVQFHCPQHCGSSLSWNIFVRTSLEIGQRLTSQQRKQLLTSGGDFSDNDKQNHQDILNYESVIAPALKQYKARHHETKLTISRLFSTVIGYDLTFEAGDFVHMHDLSWSQQNTEADVLITQINSTTGEIYRVKKSLVDMKAKYAHYHPNMNDYGGNISDPSIPEALRIMIARLFEYLYEGKGIDGPNSGFTYTTPGELQYSYGMFEAVLYTCRLLHITAYYLEREIQYQYALDSPQRINHLQINQDLSILLKDIEDLDRLLRTIAISSRYQVDLFNRNLLPALNMIIDYSSRLNEIISRTAILNDKLSQRYKKKSSMQISTDVDIDGSATIDIDDIDEEEQRELAEFERTKLKAFEKTVTSLDAQSYPIYAEKRFQNAPKDVSHNKGSGVVPFYWPLERVSQFTYTTLRVKRKVSMSEEVFEFVDKPLSSQVNFPQSSRRSTTVIHERVYSKSDLSKHYLRRYIPLLSLGTWQLDDPLMCESAVYNAIKEGIRHIDSAQAYRNEVHTGKAIARILEKDKLILREDLFVATKLSDEQHNGGYEGTIALVQQQIQELQCSYIDLYYLHSPFRDENKLEGTLIAIAELMQQGKIKSIGVSNFGEPQLLHFYPFLKRVAHEQSWTDEMYQKMHPVALQNKWDCYHVGKQFDADASDIHLVAHQNNLLIMGYSLFSGYPFTLLPLKDPILDTLAKRLTARSQRERHNNPTNNEDISVAMVLIRAYMQMGVGTIIRTTNVQHMNDAIDAIQLTGRGDIFGKETMPDLTLGELAIVEGLQYLIENHIYRAG